MDDPQSGIATEATDAHPVTGPVTEVLLADRLLRSDEEIILVAKPSAWMIVLLTAPLLAALALLVLAAYASRRLGVPLPDHTVKSVVALCLLIAAAQTIINSFRWLGRLYVLTNRRLLRLRGVIHVNATEAPVARVLDVAVVSCHCERLLGLGSLRFQIEDNPYLDPDWTFLHAPEDVAEQIRQAARRARNHRGQ